MITRSPSAIDFTTTCTMPKGRLRTSPIIEHQTPLASLPLRLPVVSAISGLSRVVQFYNHLTIKLKTRYLNFYFHEGKLIVFRYICRCIAYFEHGLAILKNFSTGFLSFVTVHWFFQFYFANFSCC